MDGAIKLSCFRILTTSDGGVGANPSTRKTHFLSQILLNNKFTIELLMLQRKTIQNLMISHKKI